jgi:hypothetical protein
VQPFDELAIDVRRLRRPQIAPGRLEGRIVLGLQIDVVVAGDGQHVLDLAPRRGAKFFPQPCIGEIVFVLPSCVGDVARQQDHTGRPQPGSHVLHIVNQIVPQPAVWVVIVPDLSVV